MVKKEITPRGDGNLIHCPFNHSIFWMVKKEITPRVDGNLCSFYLFFPGIVVKKEITPRGDGNYLTITCHVKKHM